MKKFFALGLFFLLAGSIPILAAKLEIKYDRFKKQTIVSTVPHRLPPSRPCLSLFTTFPGEVPVEPPEVVIISLDSINKGWAYLQCNETAFLLDDTLFSPGKGVHRGDVLSSGGVFESVLFSVPFNKLKKMSMANKVEGKICNTEFILNEEEIQDIRDLIKIFISENKD